jgi:SAM-dependent methyltransferase
MEPKPQTASPVPDHVRAQYPDRRFFEYREYFLRHLMRDVMSRLPPRAKEARAPTALDVGCNGGRYTALLAHHGLRAHGVDLAPTLIRDARAAHPDCTFGTDDAQQLSLADGAVDCAASFGLLQVLPDWRRALAEIVRVVRPGGVALVETNRAFPWWEAAAKSALYLARRSLPPADVRHFYEAHTQGASRPLERGLRKFSWPDLQAAVGELPLSRVIVHDPRKHRVLHDFMWAVTLIKRADGAAPIDGPDIIWCPHCLHVGVIRVREHRA